MEHTQIRQTTQTNTNQQQNKNKTQNTQNKHKNTVQQTTNNTYNYIYQKPTNDNHDITTHKTIKHTTNNKQMPSQPLIIATTQTTTITKQTETIQYTTQQQHTIHFSNKTHTN